MSINNILEYFTTLYNVTPTTEAQRVLRSDPIRIAITHLVTECELANTSTQIDLDIVQEVLDEFAVEHPTQKLRPQIRGKLMKVLQLINAGKAPTTFAIPDWKLAYEQHYKLGTAAPQLQVLNRITEPLTTFAWPASPQEALIYFLTNIRAWGNSQSIGAARYLSTARDSATNALIRVDMSHHLDDTFDLALLGKLNILLCLSPELQGRVHSDQSTGRQLFEDIINTLVPPLQFTMKKFEAIQKFHKLHYSAYTTAEGFISARNNMLRTLAMLGKVADVEFLYNSMLSAIAGVPELLNPYMQYVQQPQTETNLKMMEIDVLRWGQMNNNNKPPPTAAIRTLTTQEAQGAQLDELTKQISLLSAQGGGRGGRGAGRGASKGAGKGSSSKGGGRKGGEHGDQAATSEERLEWNPDIKGYYSTEMKVVRDNCNARARALLPGKEAVKGTQKPPDTNMHCAVVNRPPRDNAGSAATSFALPNPIDDANYPGFSNKAILHLAQSDEKEYDE
jgi:uncharacterized membrane protein YgcG